MKFTTLLPLALLATGTAAFGADAQKDTFGKLADGTAVDAVTLTKHALTLWLHFPASTYT